MKFKSFSIVRLLTISLLVILAILACEPDDLCDQSPVTPSLVVRMYNASSTSTTSKVTNLLVYGEGNSKALSYSTTDSLALPLKVSSPSTTYVMIKNAVYNSTTGAVTSGSVATVTFTYDIEQKFVSKACGFQAIYKNLTVSVENASSSWMSSITVNNTTVENESSAQVYMYH